MQISHLIAFTSFTLSFSTSVFLLIFLVAVAVGISIFTYRYTVPEVTRRRRVALIFLRSTALALLLILLFEPVLNLERTEMISPHIAVLLDNSKSLTIQDNGVERATLVRKLISVNGIGELEKIGDVTNYLFAGKTAPLQSLSPDSLTVKGGETNISKALQQVYEDLSPKNLCSVVLVTDGNFTSGRNPVYTAQDMGVPVFVVGVGDSTEKKDILVSRILANNIAYVESSIPVDATIRCAGYSEGSAQVTLIEGTNIIERKQIQLQVGVNEYPVHFTYVPKTEGSKKMTIEVSALPGELTVKNNRRTFYIKVLKSKMNIVLIAGAPSPDVSLFEQVLQRDPNLMVTSFIQKVGASWYDAAPTQKTLTDADCIVLIGYPLAQAGTAVLSMIQSAIEKNNKPLFLLFSREIDLQKLRASLDSYLPFDIVQTRKEEAQVFFDLNPDARQNPIISSGIPFDVWSKLPPIFKTESSFRARVGAQTIGSMKINAIVFNEPLLLTRKLSRSRVLAFTGYGLWRWQLAYDVLDGKLPNIMISNAIRWLTARDEDKRVRIKPVKEFFDSGEQVEITAQVYNESYEPVDDAAVSVVVKKEGEDQELFLSPLGSGRYSGTLEVRSEGDYSFSGAAMLGKTELGKDAGRFSVGELNVEFLETSMNNILLRQIAGRTGGSYFHIDDISGLPDAVGSSRFFKSDEQIIKKDIQLWNLVWLLAASILFFAAEWYVRKQSGMI